MDHRNHRTSAKEQENRSSAHRAGWVACISCTVDRSTVAEYLFVVSTLRTGKLAVVVAKAAMLIGVMASGSLRS
jgi:hypothetical protein